MMHESYGWTPSPAPQPKLPMLVSSLIVLAAAIAGWAIWAALFVLVKRALFG